MERTLAASLGAAAARFIVEDRFTISKDEAQQLAESFQTMQRSLRPSEQLLASVVESVEDCIFTTDISGRLISLNAGGGRLLGLGVADVRRLTYLDVLADADRRRVGGAIREALADGRAWRGSVNGLTRHGRSFPAHLALACVFDAKRNILGAVGVLRDLTEQVATQQRLIQREKLASLGEMAAGVAHEIRNPLGGIKMATRLLASTDFGGARIPQEMAHAIVSGIGEIERIIADLLEYARTSGSTGKPKGIIHTTGGYLTGITATHKWVFDVHDEDVFWCTADVGWVTGHSYVVYGPLANGATTVMYEGTPDHPDRDRFWRIIEKHGITICYTAPTAIRTFMKWGDEYPKRCDLSSLRLLGTVGEPINREAWVWYWKVIGGGRWPVPTM